MRFIQILLCFAVAATASSSAFTAAGVDPARTVIYVNTGAGPGGDGSWNLPYRNLQPALKKARATVGPVTVHVAPGSYVVNSTLVINRPLTLRGSSELVKDARGLPTGEVLPGTETSIVASAGLGAEPLISVGRADGIVFSRVTIRNLVLTHANSQATQLTLRRVQDYRVSNNVFRRGARVGLESIASSGEVIGNHFSRLVNGAILAAGYPASPSNVLFQGNRSVNNKQAGVLLNGASMFIPEHGDELIADVVDNELTSNRFGAHLSIIDREPGLPGDTQETGNIHALLKGNLIRDNTTGVVVEAGYPYRELEGGACDPRKYSGSVDLRSEGNSMWPEYESANLWVTLTRHPGSEGSAGPEFFAAWDYLHASTITISSSGEDFLSGWLDITHRPIIFDNPERDPHVGSCPGDENHEWLQNELRYNGRLQRPTTPS